MTPLILASASAARGRILTSLGYRFEARPSRIDEAALKIAARGEAPEEIARLLACAKAEKISAQHPGALVLGSDQILELDGEILDKAESVEGAKAKLRRLAGRSHRLLSAAALVRDREVVWSRWASARLAMRSIDEDQLAAYAAAAGDALTRSVGAYEIEGAGGALFSAVEGDPFVIQGLPLLDLVPILSEWGIHPWSV